MRQSTRGLELIILLYASISDNFAGIYRKGLDQSIGDEIHGEEDEDSKIETRSKNRLIFACFADNPKRQH